MICTNPFSTFSGLALLISLVKAYRSRAGGEDGLEKELKALSG
jgi:hypothetical protein